MPRANVTMAARETAGARRRDRAASRRSCRNQSSRAIDRGTINEYASELRRIQPVFVRTRRTAAVTVDRFRDAGVRIRGP
jgi:hypothetical protein